jgi:hypothetical protein
LENTVIVLIEPERLHQPNAVTSTGEQLKAASPLLNRAEAETERHLQGQRANNLLQVYQIAIDL